MHISESRTRSITTVALNQKGKYFRRGLVHNRTPDIRDRVRYWMQTKIIFTQLSVHIYIKLTDV